MTFVVAFIIGFTVIVLGMMAMATIVAAWPLFLALAIISLVYRTGKFRHECCEQCCCGD